jgi:hypothetical protein
MSREHEFLDANGRAIAVGDQVAYTVSNRHGVIRRGRGEVFRVEPYGLVQILLAETEPVLDAEGNTVGELPTRPFLARREVSGCEELTAVYRIHELAVEG